MPDQKYVSTVLVYDFDREVESVKDAGCCTVADRITCLNRLKFSTNTWPWLLVLLPGSVVFIANGWRDLARAVAVSTGFNKCCKPSVRCKLGVLVSGSAPGSLGRANLSASFYESLISRGIT